MLWLLLKTFPKQLQDKILNGAKKHQLDITFIDGSFIEAENTNINFIESYKAIFKSKYNNLTKYLVVLIFDKELESNLAIFTNEIGTINKCSIISLLLSK